MSRHLTLSKALTAVLLFMGIAFGQQAMADGVNLSEDHDFAPNEVGYWYVNMPRSGANQLFLSVDDLNAGNGLFL